MSKVSSGRSTGGEYELSVLKFASTRRWRDGLLFEKPRMTIQNYLWGLGVFCTWAKMNPDELMLERKMEISLKQDDSKTASFRRIEEYQLNDRSKTKHSRALITKALSSFYTNNVSII